MCPSGHRRVNLIASSFATPSVLARHVRPLIFFLLLCFSKCTPHTTHLYFLCFPTFLQVRKNHFFSFVLFKCLFEWFSCLICFFFLVSMMWFVWSICGCFVILFSLISCAEKFIHGWDFFFLKKYDKNIFVCVYKHSYCFFIKWSTHY